MLLVLLLVMVDNEVVTTVVVVSYASKKKQLMKLMLVVTICLTNLILKIFLINYKDKRSIFSRMRKNCNVIKRNQPKNSNNSKVHRVSLNMASAATVMMRMRKNTTTSRPMVKMQKTGVVLKVEHYKSFRTSQTFSLSSDMLRHLSKNDIPQQCVYLFCLVLFKRII